MNKTLNLIGWILTGLLVAFFLFMSIAGKFFNEEMITGMETWGLTGWITIIGIGELIALLLFLYPRTSLFGLMVLSGHMGGAIAIHLANGDSILMQSGILALLWVSLFLRKPNWFKQGRYFSSESKQKRITGIVLTTIITAIFALSAIGKLMGPEELITQFSKWNLLEWKTLFAVGELSFVILLFVRKTTIYGTLLLSAYMGGAIVTHMSNAEPFFFQAALLIVIWSNFFLLTENKQVNN